MQIKTPLCSCKRKATHICLNHSIYLCEVDRFKHKCSVIDLQNFSKSTRLNKMNFVKKLKKLKIESKQNKQELIRINRETVSELKRVGSFIKGMVDKVISAFCVASEQLITTKLIKEIEMTESLLNGWESKKDYLTVDSFLKQKPFGKIRKEERDRYTKLKKELKDNDMLSDIQILLQGLKARLGYSIKAFSVKKVIESDEKYSKQNLIRYNTELVIDEKYYGNKRAFSKESFVKKRRKRCKSFVPLSKTPNKYFTNEYKPKRRALDNYLSNVKDGNVMTPLESTFVNNIKKSALDKIKQSGLSMESNSLKSFDPNNIKLFDQSLSISDDNSPHDDSYAKEQEKSLLEDLKQIKEKMQNKVYFNQFNKETITQDVESFLFKFKADFNRLVQSWNLK